MGRKNSGLEAFFSVLVSISLLSATLVFSEDLVNSLSNFTLGFFNLAVSAEEFKVETLKNASSAKTDVYNEVVGFGNGFESEREAADTETPEDSPYYIKISQQELIEYLRENNCGYIFVEQSDSYLEDGFGNMFDDDLENCKDGVSALYKINGDKFEFIGEVE